MPWPTPKDLTMVAGYNLGWLQTGWYDMQTMCNTTDAGDEKGQEAGHERDQAAVTTSDWERWPIAGPTAEPKLEPNAMSYRAARESLASFSRDGRTTTLSHRAP